MGDAERRELQRRAEQGDLRAMGELIQDLYRAEDYEALRDELPEPATHRAAIAAVRAALFASQPGDELSEETRETVLATLTACEAWLLSPSDEHVASAEAACKAAGSAAYGEERDVSEAAFRIPLAAAALFANPRHATSRLMATFGLATIARQIREELLAWCSGNDPLARRVSERKR